MSSFPFRLLRRVSPSLGAACSAAAVLHGKLGWWRSVREARPVDAKGAPLPWMTYPALAWLDLLDLSAARIFEYGAGWGTLHWARRCASITAVEADAAWAERLRPQLPPHATVLGPLSGQAYAEASLPGAPWDVVIVDGDHRPECARVAATVASSRGLIILDNADWFPEAAAELRATGRTQVDFQGFGPCNAYTWTTAVFFGPAFSLPRLPRPWSGTDRGAIPYQPAP